MIGFPDFPSGAMEHWGIVGFRLVALKKYVYVKICIILD